MTWAAVLALAGGTYALKAAGPVLLGGRALPRLAVRTADLLPAALLAALIAVAALTSDGEWSIDARAAGVAAALLVAWRRGSFLTIVVVAMVVTAGLRGLAPLL
jgi:branched-subunit amino acid transport protein